MKNTIHISLLLIFLITTLLSISSYSHHSSIGIDHDFQKQNRILHKYYRINWTGYGSILLGYGSQWRQKSADKPLEKFDPASSLLKPAEKSATKNSIWNTAGFWFVKSEKPAPTLWIGIPSWLPVLLLALILFNKSLLRR